MNLKTLYVLEPSLTASESVCSLGTVGNNQCIFYFIFFSSRELLNCMEMYDIIMCHFDYKHKVDPILCHELIIC